MPVYRIVGLDELGPLDVHELYKLRVDVFVEEQQCPYAEIDFIDADPLTRHVLAYDGTTLIGCARFFPSTFQGQDVVQFGRFVITPDYRGGNDGRALFETTIRAMSRAFKNRPMFLNAQEPLVPCYQHFGFEPVGSLFDDRGVPHQPMLRPLGG